MTEFDTLLDRLCDAHAALGREQAARIAAEHQLTTLQAAAPLRANATVQANDAIRAEVIALMEHMAAGRKIDAIKSIRTLTGYGIKESKDAVEAGMYRHRSDAVDWPSHPKETAIS